MAVSGGFEVIRDPLWNNIGIDERALAVLDTAPFQRLRYVRQLGHAFLVYPGATHTRFEHALGAYHLACRALTLLHERSVLDDVPHEEIVLVRLAALLHDVGHYPFSHALEEAGLPSHEDLAAEHLAHPEIAGALARTGIPDVGPRIASLIAGGSDSPLQGLISGPLDLDKLDYLTRDARMCGVPYGTVDVDRLLHSITLVGLGGTLAVGMYEKGVSALESLLFAKYQMYRNVYWHHAVRAATTMFQRLVRTALRTGQVEPASIARATDETLMEALSRLPDPSLVHRLRERRLYKRVLDLPATVLPAGAGAWVAADPDLCERVEDRVAEELALEPGECLLDFPAKPEMLSGEMPIVARDGAQASPRLGIQQVADELHTQARRFRIYAARPVELQPEPFIELLEADGASVRAGLDEGEALLAVR